MEFIRTTELSRTFKTEVFDLWNNEYPEKLKYNTPSDFESYIDNLVEQSHILMLNDTKNIKGWYFDFMRDYERWFAIIMDSKIHGHGFGTQILNLAKEKESELNGWVIDHNKDKKQNGEIYKSPLDFYLKNGFDLLSENRLELETISAVKVKWEKTGYNNTYNLHAGR